MILVWDKLSLGGSGPFKNTCCVGSWLCGREKAGFGRCWHVRWVLKQSEQRKSAWERELSESRRVSDGLILGAMLVPNTCYEFIHLINSLISF